MDALRRDSGEDRRQPYCHPRWNGTRPNPQGKSKEDHSSPSTSRDVVHKSHNAGLNTFTASYGSSSAGSWEYSACRTRFISIGSVGRIPTSSKDEKPVLHRGSLVGAILDSIQWERQETQPACQYPKPRWWRERENVARDSKGRGKTEHTHACPRTPRVGQSTGDHRVPLPYLSSEVAALGIYQPKTKEWKAIRKKAAIDKMRLIKMWEDPTHQQGKCIKVKTDRVKTFCAVASTVAREELLNELVKEEEVMTFKKEALEAKQEKATQAFLRKLENLSISGRTAIFNKALNHLPTASRTFLRGTSPCLVECKQLDPNLTARLESLVEDAARLTSGMSLFDPGILPNTAILIKNLRQL
ncbi:hypothetical protein EMCRGX_G004320 [Ephydatia muelleri]